MALLWMDWRSSSIKWQNTVAKWEATSANLQEDSWKIEMPRLLLNGLSLLRLVGKATKVSRTTTDHRLANDKDLSGRNWKSCEGQHGYGAFCGHKPTTHDLRRARLVRR